LFASSKIDRFAFDVEILTLAYRRGLRVVEVPVTWYAREGSRVRPTADSLNMAWDLVRFRLRSSSLRGRNDQHAGSRS
jgi:dolichyl-phosphate beta-glucosyltransferase